MSKRSNWCEFDKETRKYIKKRDNDECVICHHKGALQIMHIFLSRAKGGKGDKRNGCLGCIKCHKIIDNPIGKEENELSKKYLWYCKGYLIKQEGITDQLELKEELKFKKEKVKISFEEKKENYKTTFQKCKNCAMLIKVKGTKTTIPSYYCKYKKINLNKSTKACNKFRGLYDK